MNKHSERTSKTRGRPLEVLLMVALLLGLMTPIAHASNSFSQAAAFPGATSPAGLFVPQQTRILDTRDGTGGYTTKMPANTWRQISVRPALPNEVSAVQISVTAVSPSVARPAPTCSSPPMPWC